MPSKTFLHTFEGGINQDLFPSAVKSSQSLEIINMRPVESDTNTMYALETVEGNSPAYDAIVVIESGSPVTLSGNYIVIEGSVSIANNIFNKYDIINIPTSDTVTGDGKLLSLDRYIPQDTYIVGGVSLRDKLYLFVTENNSVGDYSGTSYIIECSINDEGRIYSSTIIYDDSNNIDGSSLAFNVNNKIKAVAVQETEDIKKIYWIDDHNPIRYAIVSRPLTVNGEPYVVSSNPYMSVNKLEFLPAMAPVSLEVDSIVNGNLYSGMIKYAYQLYINNGSETAFSPATGFYHVTESSDLDTNDIHYTGSLQDKRTGKGFRIKFNNQNKGFDRLRLVAVHYGRYNEIFEIRVAAEAIVDPNGGEVYVYDTGESLASYTIEEFSVIANNIFKANDIDTKDGRLLASNVTEEYFKLPEDYDTRAYRFNSSDVARVYEADNSYYEIQSNGDWVKYNSAGNPTGDSGSDWTIPKDADCINKYNNLDNDTDPSYRYIYRSSGELGARGKNISLRISDSSTITIDNSNDDKFVYQDSGDMLGSYTGYSNPWHTANSRGFQAGETYRVGIQFVDERGRTSFVKWIADIRMPRRNYYNGSFHPYTLVVNATSNIVEVIPITLEYSVGILPQGAIGHRLMVVPLSIVDHTVLANGVLVPLEEVSAPTSGNYIIPMEMGQASHNQVVHVNGDLVKLVSPEISFNRTLSFRPGDKLIYSGYFAYNHVGDYASDYAVFNKASSITYDINSDTDSNLFSDVTDLRIANPAVDIDDVIYVNSVKFNNYIHTGTDKVRSHGGTGAVLSISNTNFYGYNKDLPYVTYERNRFGSQYGGNTYESRHNNVYVPVTQFSSDISSWLKTTNGDTYISYFDYLHGIWDLRYSGCNADESMSESVMFPVESTINCPLRSQITVGKHIYIHSSNSLAHLMQEAAGLHDANCTSIGGMSDFEQEHNYYTYNSVYSQFESIDSYPTEPFDMQDNEVFDTRVRYSQKKINGEKSDSWTRFLVNDYMDVDSSKGSVTAIKVFQNRLFFFQEHGTGVISMNERALIKDNNPGMLVVGEAGVFSRYDYLSDTVGNLDKWSVITSPNSIYWFDPSEKAIYRYKGGASPLSKLAGIESWVRNNYETGDTVITSYDKKHNEVWFTLSGSKYTVAFSEILDVFTSFYSFVPEQYMTLYDGKIYSTNDNRVLYLHNSEDDVIYNRFRWYDEPKEQPKVKFIVNDNYTYTKVFDNIAFRSNAYRLAQPGTDSVYVNDYYTTFDRLRVYSEFQNTDWVELVPNNNIMRRENEWTLVIPRDAVNQNISDRPDIFDPANLDQDRLFRPRIRGEYCVVELTMSDNTEISKFVLPYVKVNYRLSYR